MDPRRHDGQFFPGPNSHAYSSYQPHFRQAQLPPAPWYYSTNPYTRPQSQYRPMNTGFYQYHPNVFLAGAAASIPGSYQSVAYPAQDVMRSQSGSVPAPTTYPDALIALRPSHLIPLHEFLGHRAPYYPPLPWLSVPEQVFPRRVPKLRRRPRTQNASCPVELPSRKDSPSGQHPNNLNNGLAAGTSNLASAQEDSRETSSPEDDGSATSGLSTKISASSTAALVTAQIQLLGSNPIERHAHKSGNIVPVVPNIAIPPKPPSAVPQSLGGAGAVEESGTKVPKPPPKSWAALLRTHTVSCNATSTALPENTFGSSDISQRRVVLANAVSSFVIQKPSSDSRLYLVEPRGLINAGNMCYMNSVLQVLIFCVPFYNFLSHVGKNAVHTLKSDTPLLDAMIMYMREFRVVNSAESAEQLRMRLKPVEMEQFGEPLLPEYVYEAIRQMSRFATMQRGHQQDAEEFLGFLLEELQNECARAVRLARLSISAKAEGRAVSHDNGREEGWLEVGPKQKAAITQSSGVVDFDTPIRQIFGGQLRSELKVRGAKNSVTMEPYQSLQLDIGSPEVRNITDALKGLTKPETLTGDFGSGATATKQVFIESLPPVLIIHLKRFQYDNTGGTQKIWKRVGYPLELEIPKEVFPQSKRGNLTSLGGLPKYRLISVIYHHGKSASAGHYTTDLLRQDSREWLRVDDTVIKRLQSQDIEAINEDDPKILAAALQQHQQDQLYGSGGLERVMGLAAEINSGGNEWIQAKVAGKKLSGIVNSSARSSGIGTPTSQQPLRDNKVAYILFYERKDS